MLTEAGQIEIQAVLNEINYDYPSKAHLRTLQKLKFKATNVKDNECFCNTGKRAKWLKEFLSWYEENA